MSLRRWSYSAFCTLKTRISTMFVKKSIKILSVAYQLSVKQVLIASYWIFLLFVYQLYTQNKVYLKCWRKIRKQIFFALNILNETECLVYSIIICAQIIRKKAEKVLMKRHYRTCHTKLHSIMAYGCIKDNSFQNSGI